MTRVIGSQSDVPDSGDPILSPWYQDTAKKIVHVFPTTAARDLWTDAPNGAMAEAPAGMLWIRFSGQWRLYEALPVHVASTGITGNNLGQGISTLNGQVALLSSPVNRTWTVWWNYYFSGHSAGSEFRTRMFRVSDSGVLAISGYAHYAAGESYAGVHCAQLFVGANSAQQNIGFQLEVNTLAANTNVNGFALTYGFATEASA